MGKNNFLNSVKSPWLYGFIISLLGSLPLGYINVIGLQITLQQGTLAAIYFILGIVFIEIFVLKITSFAAHWLVSQKKLLLLIDIFTIVFFTAIAYYFFTNIGGNSQNFSLSSLKLSTTPFLLGLLLNTLNFIQWPYWSGVYLYLYRNQNVDFTTKKAKNYFIIGALIGTALGMLLFSQLGKLLLIDHKNDFNFYLNLIFAVLFLALTVFQTIKFCYKQFKNKE
jgi:threonine/homoserine/homoserine lactone efflux protein